MPITYVGAGAATNTASTNVTPALPAGIAAGDLLVAHLAFDASDAGMGTPAGWTKKLEHETESFRGQYLFWKRAGSSESAPTFVTGDAEVCLAQIAAFSGVIATGDPFAGLTTAAPGVSAQNIGALSAPASPPEGCLVLVGGVKADDWTSVATLSGDSLTWAEIGEPDNATAGIGMVWDYAIAPGTPTLTSKTFTVTGGASANTLGFYATIAPAPQGVLRARVVSQAAMRASSW